VIQTGSGKGFKLKASQPILIADDIGAQNLDGDLAV
jgi:hypothetical protein